MLSTDRVADPTSKLSRMQRCVGVIERCKSLRGRRYRPALPLALPAYTWLPFADDPDTFQTQSRSVDGRLALPDAGHRGRRARGDARDERIPVYGDAHAYRFLLPVPADPSQWRLRDAEDRPAAPAYWAQFDPL